MSDESIQGYPSNVGSVSPESVQPVSQQSSPSSSSDAGDVSRNTIIILVLLTLVISVLGTWTVMNEVSSFKVASASSTSKISNPSHADVKLTILNENEYNARQQAPVSTGMVTGNVIFNILKE